jgi:hypothetical protein
MRTRSDLNHTGNTGTQSVHLRMTRDDPTHSHCRDVTADESPRLAHPTTTTQSPLITQRKLGGTSGVDARTDFRTPATGLPQLRPNLRQPASERARCGNTTVDKSAFCATSQSLIRSGDADVVAPEAEAVAAAHMGAAAGRGSGYSPNSCRRTVPIAPGPAEALGRRPVRDASA